MAKIPFSKLNKVKNLPAITHQLGEYAIEVEQYLSLEDKINLMAAVIEQAGNGEEGFFNIVKLDAYYRIEMIKAYTNISFTEKQLEDTPKLFDAIVLNDVWAFVEDKIPVAEREYIWDNILNLAKEITSYNNSVLGILKALQNSTNFITNTELQNIEDIHKEAEALKEIPLIKDILPLMGGQ